MTFADLMSDVLGQLPEAKRLAMAAVVDEFGADENFRFVLALLAGTTTRERQVVRLFLRELDRLDNAQPV